MVAALAVAGCRSSCSDGPRADSQPPTPAATAESAAVPGLPPAIPNAGEGVQRVRPALRACFAAQLARAPTPKASVTFQIVVGPEGGVTEVTTKAQEGLEGTTLACMLEALRTATFDKPMDGQPTTIFAPFTFYNAVDAGARDADAAK